MGDGKVAFTSERPGEDSRSERLELLGIPPMSEDVLFVLVVSLAEWEALTGGEKRVDGRPIFGGEPLGKRYCFEG